MIFYIVRWMMQCALQNVPLNLNRYTLGFISGSIEQTKCVVHLRCARLITDKERASSLFNASAMQISTKFSCNVIAKLCWITIFFLSGSSRWFMSVFAGFMYKLECVSFSIMYKVYLERDDGIFESIMSHYNLCT